MFISVITNVCCITKGTTEGDHLLQTDIEVFGPGGPNISKYSDTILGGSIFFVTEPPR